MILLRYCSLSIAIISILTAAPNIYMVMQIYKDENQSIGAGRMFTLIGVSNVACALSTTIHMFMTVNTPFPVICLVSTCTTIFFLQQLGFNVSLAYERLQVLKKGLSYHTSDAKRELERKLSIRVFISSMILGIISSTLRFTLGNMMFKSIPLATARILCYIALCVIYVKLYFAIKSHNNKIATSTKQGEPSAVDNKIIERRQKDLNHAKMFFTGITSSFFISNLPTMIIFLTVDHAPVCNTVEGILVTTSINLSLIGMAFDAAWYFYMKRRSKRS